MLYFQSLFALGNAAVAPAVRLKISKHFWEKRGPYKCQISLYCTLIQVVQWATAPWGVWSVSPAAVGEETWGLPCQVSPATISISQPPLTSVVHRSVCHHGGIQVGGASVLCCILLYTIRSDTVIIVMLSHPCQESFTLRISHRKFRSTRTNQ